MRALVDIAQLLVDISTKIPQVTLYITPILYFS